ncbi:MAG: tRNA (N6-threonylcarbamoyladenosine(37)-N6)-methyltransferase TrmO [Thermodesulfobacteriota bacterium]|nr:tRNA (N6-threonylcarbamoyladenosine(37)-N6)-methyltransferase TrmO [Thermodesulfobacteriota bacterium]
MISSKILRSKGSFRVVPIGIIKKEGKTVYIEIPQKYKDALRGLDQFSHIIVSSWFHKNDTRGKRSVLQVHPKGNMANPLTGVFATRSPARPNLIAISVCKILGVEGNIVHIDKTDALNGTPVIDIKPYIPRIDAISDARIPKWMESFADFD